MRDDQLHAFVDDELARRTVDARRRRRWLGRQLDEDRTFEDVCRDATTSQDPVDVHVAGGRVYRGVARAAGHRVLAVVNASGVAYIAVDAVIGVRIAAGSTLDAEPVSTLRAATVADVVGAFAERGADVVLAGGTLVHRGRIAGVGRDLVSFVDGTHMRLSAVAEAVSRR
ncbi:MAG TPA: hypothetical protein VFZ70_06190 [Euzebyales bacterium]